MSLTKLFPSNAYTFFFNKLQGIAKGKQTNPSNEA